MVECSSLTPCYDDVHEIYSDSLCPAREKCGVWNKTVHANSYYNGCILDKYCELDGTFEGTPVKFRCLNGEKSDHGKDRYAIVFKLSSMYHPMIYTKTFMISGATDILIEGKEDKDGYTWSIGG